METTMDDLSYHLSTLSTNSSEIGLLDKRCPSSTFQLPSMSSCPMATDDYNHLLVYHHQTLLLFQIPTFEILFSFSVNPFIETPISDICYYSPLNSFLLSSSNTIYSLSSTKQIDIIHKFSNLIWSITHTLNYIFICYLFGDSIEQWELNPNENILLNRWLKESLIDQCDMGINSIRIINEYLGMTIKENNFSWRIDLFDLRTMTKIHRGQTIQQENGLSNWIGRLFPIDNFQWLFADGDQGLFLIEYNDHQEYKQNNLMKIACNICLIRDINTKKSSSIIVQTHESLDLYYLHS